MTIIEKYKHKPTVVSALRVTDELFSDLPQLWDGCVYNRREKIVYVLYDGGFSYPAYVGNYIVRNYNGSLSIMSQEQFNEIYE